MQTKQRRQDVLLTWVGSRDPVWHNPRTRRIELGPILSLLASRPFDVVYLLITVGSATDNFLDRANKVFHYCRQHVPAVTIKHRPLDVAEVTDYRELYRLMALESATLLKERDADQDYFVYLSPGTPQMQTVWVLLIQSGLLPARMVAATPPDLLVPGESPWYEVDLTLSDFPTVTRPGEADLRLGALTAQRDNLATENRRLAAELAARRAGAGLDLAGPEPEARSLPDRLLAYERAHYALALADAGGNAADAARQLGIHPHTFRKRAAKLGVRARDPRPASLPPPRPARRAARAAG